jgi:hypothetical protein
MVADEVFISPFNHNSVEDVDLGLILGSSQDSCSMFHSACSTYY